MNAAQTITENVFVISLCTHTANKQARVGSVMLFFIFSVERGAKVGTRAFSLLPAALFCQISTFDTTQYPLCWRDVA